MFNENTWVSDLSITTFNLQIAPRKIPLSLADRELQFQELKVTGYHQHVGLLNKFFLSIWWSSLFTPLLFSYLVGTTLANWFRMPRCICKVLASEILFRNLGIFIPRIFVRSLWQLPCRLLLHVWWWLILPRIQRASKPVPTLPF